MCAALVAERAVAPPVAQPAAPEPAVRVNGLNHYYGEGEARNQVPVSYTHLTLPTICSV